MHYELMGSIRDTVNKYFDKTVPLKILDVGSYDKNNPKRKLNCGRYLNMPPLWEYVGLDIAPGPNVDVVADGPYDYPFPDNSFDIVISANTLEHTQDMQRFVNEMKRVTKDWLIIFVPNTRPEHKHPIDCWRVFPDGMKFLLETAGMNIIEVGLSGGGKQNDTVGIARKYEKIFEK